MQSWLFTQQLRVIPSHTDHVYNYRDNAAAFSAQTAAMTYMSLFMLTFYCSGTRTPNLLPGQSWKSPSELSPPKIVL